MEERRLYARDEKGQIVKAGDDVPGILDEYLVASGGVPRFREAAATANYPSSGG